jgi:phage baseplate assembly protein W
MSGISPKLPLTEDKTSIGYALNKNLKQVIKQNLKHLLLTNPGEKVFDIDFGVGVRRFLFEQNSSAFDEQISSKINQQVNKYMPFININKITILKNTDFNNSSVSIFYSVPSISINDILSIDILAGN